MKPFHGAKLALFIGEKVLAILRDDYDWIPYPNTWDVPGGERDGQESPEDCALRETREEVGLKLSEDDLIWKRQYFSTTRPGEDSWFFVAHMPAELESDVVLGDEGQKWELMEVESFLERADVIPFLQERLRDYLVGSR